MSEFRNKKFKTPASKRREFFYDIQLYFKNSYLKSLLAKNHYFSPIFGTFLGFLDQKPVKV